MAPSRKIILNETNCEIKHVQQQYHCNSQVIIYYNDPNNDPENDPNNDPNNGKIIWNFNADVENDIMGKCFGSSIWMKEAGCKENVWYKRKICLDLFIQVIIEEMSDSEITNYKDRTSPVNQENINGHENQKNFNMSANPSEITMTFEN